MKVFMILIVTITCFLGWLYNGVPTDGKPIVAIVLSFITSIIIMNLLFYNE